MKHCIVILFVFLGTFKVTAQRITLCFDNCADPSTSEIARTANAKISLNKLDTFTGLVYNFETLNQGKSTVLYLNGDYPNQSLSIIIDNNTTSTRKHPEFLVRGNFAMAKGFVKMFRGKPSIKVSDWDGVTLIDAYHKQQLPYPNAIVSKQYYKPLAQFGDQGGMMFNDTVSYLFDNFIYHQIQYKGNNLNLLLKRIGLPVKNYLFAKNAISIEFDNDDAVSKKTFGRMPAVLMIYFKETLSSKDLSRDHGEYTINLQQVYGKKIIDSVNYWHVNK